MTHHRVHFVAAITAALLGSATIASAQDSATEPSHTLGEVVGEPDVVMRREQQAGALPLEPLRDCGDLLRRGRLLGQ